MEQTLKWFEDHKFIAVVRTSSSEDAESMIKAAVSGGIRIFEISMHTSQAIRLIESYAKKDSLLIGAGTVTDGEMTQRAINAGAQFISSHYTNRDVINVAKHNENFVIQGACTPTEAMTALEWGADLIKVYPASLLGGPAYCKSLRGPLPYLKLLAAGGVTFETAFDYLKHCVAVTVGEAVFDKALVRAHSWSEITERAKQFTQRLESLRVSK